MPKTSFGPIDLDFCCLTLMTKMERGILLPLECGFRLATGERQGGFERYRR